ncbi:hypothetical protein [Alkalibacillus aidingensis]|uniref:hypothetical protein n=1 Tax=Alkalibacillus aidingensis TaxID=2747607 RepID=UPI0016611FDB|nr:hypothetical protein [Alkalibacillus aidingensis]
MTSRSTRFSPDRRLEQLAGLIYFLFIRLIVYHEKIVVWVQYVYRHFFYVVLQKSLVEIALIFKDFVEVAHY